VPIDERRKRPAVQVQEVVPQVANRSVQHHVLVDRSILVAAKPVLEQAQVPARVPARMPDPPAPKEKAAVQVVAGVARRGDGRLDLDP
jgi:hypothetical protein